MSAAVLLIKTSYSLFCFFLETPCAVIFFPQSGTVTHICNFNTWKMETGPWTSSTTQKVQDWAIRDTFSNIYIYKQKPPASQELLSSSLTTPDWLSSGTATLTLPDEDLKLGQALYP